MITATYTPDEQDNNVWTITENGVVVAQIIMPDSVTISDQALSIYNNGLIEQDPVPSSVSLSDWRIALLLWGRLDDVKASIEARKQAGDILGFIAQERFEYANTVHRSELMQLKDIFDFSEADVNESMIRAHAISTEGISVSSPPSP